jgi:hypothetical protein
MTSIAFTVLLAAGFYTMFMGQDHETGILLLIGAFLTFGYKLFRAALGKDFE